MECQSMTRECQVQRGFLLMVARAYRTTSNRGSQCGHTNVVIQIRRAFELKYLENWKLILEDLQFHFWLICFRFLCTDQPRQHISPWWCAGMRCIFARRHRYVRTPRKAVTSGSADQIRQCTWQYESYCTTASNGGGRIFHLRTHGVQACALW